MDDVDKSVVEGAAALKHIFCGLQLSLAEKEFVNEAGRKIAECAFKTLTSLPESQAQNLRPIVMAVAIACLIGPPEPGEYGIDILSIKDI